jgi:hypothetical protein
LWPLNADSVAGNGPCSLTADGTEIVSVAPYRFTRQIKAVLKIDAVPKNFPPAARIAIGPAGIGKTLR